MFYEEEVTSLRALSKRLASLDQDAGIRMIGRSGRKKILVFVTRFGRKYTIMSYDLRSGGTPRRRLETLELEGPEAAATALKGFADSPLQAWYY